MASYWCCAARWRVWRPTAWRLTPWPNWRLRRDVGDARRGSAELRRSSWIWCASRGWPRCWGAELRLQARWQAEEREDRVGGQEEGELEDPAVCDLEHLQRPRVIARAGLARLVLPEGGRAVGGDGRDHARSTTTGAPAHPPAEDVPTPAQPQLIGRHRLRGILVNQRGERIHVVALEGVDVAAQQLTVVFAQCAGPPPGPLRQALRDRTVRRARLAEVHRPGATLPATEHVQADVGGDSIQPR